MGNKAAELCGISLPNPQPDMTLYAAILEAGFREYPLRKKNFKLFQASSQIEPVDYLPIKLDIEPTSRCNFKCSMCLMSKWGNNKRADDLSFQSFRTIIDAQLGLVELKLQGLGEPLLNPALFDMIAYARQRHLWVRTSTNASLLHRHENYKRLIDSDICEVQVSVDGTTAEVYEGIRKGGHFDQVIENCRLLNKYAQKRAEDRTRMWVVLQKNNAHQLYQFPRVAAELGFKRLTIAPELSDWGQDAWARQNAKLTNTEPINAERLHAEGKKWDVGVTSWEVGPKYTFESNKTRCPWPFSRAFISSDARIVPCCKICDPRIADFGDAYDFSMLWFSKSYQSFRRGHLLGQIPKYCNSCYVRQ